MRTFILTDVPTSVPRSSPVLAALKSFISACADEAALAHLRAQTNYSLPPGRARHAAELDHARSLFALRTVVLEMAPPGTGNKSRSQLLAERGWHSNKIRATMLKSSTGDHDSENLWSAAENDFSFFGEEGEEHDECGIYDNEPDKYFPTAHLDDKIVYTPSEGSEDTINDGTGRRRSSHSPHDSSASLHRQQPHQQYAQQNANMYRSPTVLRSPRDLPLGRNRRPSSGSADFDRDRESLRERILSTSSANRPPNEMPGSAPSTPTIASTLRSPHIASNTANFRPPTSHPNLKSPPQTPLSPHANNSNNHTAEAPTEPQVDLVAELAAWRRARRQEYTDAVIRWKLARPAVLNRSSGANVAKKASDDTFDERDMPVVPGHWKGEVQVVKNPHARARLGVVDVYGNYFEKGYLYP